MTLVLVDEGVDAAADAEATVAVAHTLGGPLEAVTAGAAGESGLSDTLATLAATGVARLHRLSWPGAAEATPQARGAALARWLTTERPSAVLAPAEGRAAEVLAHAAARARLPLAAQCVTVDAAVDGEWTVTRERAGGVLLEDARLTAPVALVTVSRAAQAPAPAAVDRCEVVEHVVEPDPVAARARVVGRTAAAGGVTLATAPVVVSGGRGVGGPEGYGVLEELAGLLGGAVGCSRVATNNGWRPHSDQVGLTGTRIAPELYVACGISGATQHWVGCMDSRVILAVNTDAEAPMVARATYAVLGDVHEVLPAVVEEIRRRREARVPGQDRAEPGVELRSDTRVP
ncbi:hypothetical protein B1813_01515 [Saccharomonospora piscinae]|uniref:Electron transfer flavoprotein alpha/beta-subunit N-terminal domain-containing protein n=1 Tax=Saccharomonospora piscinae TaxID=687388 RepID=A0A1V9ACZ0_SACPI|nr:FAD-binding protein [Saccharomonospora piscinae]OQO94794.1 hypothetical protein B1813_01515 [Saccharomonospora piscinae]